MPVRRLAIAIGAGLVVAAIVFQASLVRARDESSVSILVAARDLPARSVVVADDFAFIEVPRAQLPSGAVVAGSDVTQRVLRDPLYRGETLNERHLARSGQDFSASLLIPAEKSYAMNLPVSLFLSAPPRLQVHDRVDIVGYQRGKSLESGGVIVGNLEVIDLSPNFADNASETRYLTVAANVDEIVRMLAVREGYTLALALRPFANSTR